MASAQTCRGAGRLPDTVLAMVLAAAGAAEAEEARAAAGAAVG